MALKGKNLESTFVRGDKGFMIEIKVGSKVHLLNPESIQQPTERRSQKYINENLPKQIGDPPYEVLKIRQYNRLITLDVKGEKGDMEGVLKDYFFALSSQ